MTLVRISNVSDLATARACAALDIDFIGLNLSHGKPNAISPIKVNDYIQWLSGIEIVAQAHHLDERKAKRFMELLNLKHVEILAENYEEGGQGMWYCGSLNSPLNGTLVSKEPITDAYFELSATQIANQSITKKIDLPINLFETENGIDWDLVASTIARLRG
ncbi:MAG: hypothetical protein JXQ87_09195 [Bacteroidia bacterium]